jgi:hypothetical protein
MKLYHMSQNLSPLHHKDTTRISLKTASSFIPSTQEIKPTQSIRSSQHKNNEVNNTSVANTQQTRMYPTRYQRTPPKEMDTTPLLNPTTEAEVERSNTALSSPSCRDQRHQ